MESFSSLNKIISYLTAIETNVKLSNIEGYYDINRHLEDIIAKLLNLIYGYNLINANRIESNFPAVDLIDDDKRIAIQVTSDNSCSKISKTFEMFYDSKKDLANKYDTVKFFMLKGKLEKYNVKNITNAPEKFNIAEDILDNRDLIKKISTFNIEQLQVIEQFLEKEFIAKIVVKLDDVPKINYRQECINYMTRYVVKKNNSNHNKERLIDIFEKENRIVLLSDAGEGKTIELFNLINDINNLDKYKFPFYQRLNEYVDEEIEEFIPEEYREVYNKNIVFLLDAYDEIEEKNKKTFVRKLEKFCKQNKDVKVIVTSRKNFYNNKTHDVDGTLINFSEYILEPINKVDIERILKDNDIILEEFWKEVKEKSLGDYIHNPFYLNKILEIYIKEKRIPTSQMLMDYIIEKSYLLDVNKYKNTIDLMNEKHKLERLLKVIALTLEILGKNYLSDDEYKILINNSDNRELLQYSSIWIKNNNWSFVHNNFGEYLAAKKLNEYDITEIKTIVSYENIPNKIKASWINTLKFLINKYKNNELLEWIISCMPEFVAYVEDDLINNSTKKEILRLLIKKYNDDKVWLPYSIRAKNLVNDKDDVSFLLNIIKDNNHTTSVGNALCVIENSERLFNQENEVKKTLLYVAKSNLYNLYNKATAINLLANLKLGTYEDLIEIINYNKNDEKSILRKSYYYYCNSLKIANQAYEIIIERLDTSRNICTQDEDDMYSWEEFEEFHKIIYNITDRYVLEKLINNIDNIKLRDYTEGDLYIKNLCNAVFNTYTDEDNIIDKILAIYVKVEEQYSEANIRIIINKLKEKNMLLNFFKKYLTVSKKRELRRCEEIIDDECMKYYYKEYSEYKYEDSLTEEILRFCDNKIDYYQELKKLYEERTGKLFIINIPIDYQKIRNDSIYFFINIILHKENFLKLLGEFIEKYGQNGKIRLEQLKDLKRSCTIERDIRYKELLYFLCWNFKEEDVISADCFEKWNWNYVILGTVYRKLMDNSEIRLNNKQIRIIEEICMTEINNVNFRKGLYNHRINKICLYLWFFRNKFDFIYPENILLDMLEFEFSNSEKRIGFCYISKYVSDEKIRNRVIENLNKRNLFWQVFENHIDYCLKKNIDCCVFSVGKYLINKKFIEFGRIKAAQYMLKYMDINDFVKNYFLKLEARMQKYIVDDIIEKDKNVLYEVFLDKLLKSRRIEYKMFYAQKIIAMNKKEGLEFYYKYMKKQKAPYKDSNSLNSINKEISKIKDIDMLDLLLKILELIFQPDFKDETFDGIYNNVRASIINIMVENIEAYFYIDTKLNELFDRYKVNSKAGMISYLILDLREEYCRKSSKKYSIFEVKEMIKKLDTKYDEIRLWL